MFTYEEFQSRLKANSSPKVNKAPMGTAGAMITPSNSRPQPPISVQPLNDF